MYTKESIDFIRTMHWIVLDHLHLWDWSLAQTPAPSPSSTSNLELLQAQLEFIQAENARLSAEFLTKLEFMAKDNQKLNDQFSQFVKIVQVLLLLLGALTAAGGFVFGKSLKEASKTIKDELKDELRLHIANRVRDLVQTEMDMVRRSLAREQVIGDTSIDYLLCSGDPPKEFSFLRSRGFRNVQFYRDKAHLGTPGNIVVIDIYNWLQTTGKRFADLSDRDRQRGQQLIDDIIAVLPETSITVIYVNGIVNLPGQKNVVAANTWITLLGATANAAYVVKGVNNES